MKTLQEFFDFHIDYLHRAIEEVAPGDDPRPMLFFLGDQGIGIVPLPLRDKDAEVAACRKLMREHHATMYAMITSAWQMDFSYKPDDEAGAKRAQRLMALYEAYGSSHPEVKPCRRETCMVTAGDRDGTLIAMFDCQRDEAGKIVELVRHPARPSDNLWAGRMLDLLAEARQ